MLEIFNSMERGNIMEIIIEKGEAFWGMRAADGTRMPFAEQQLHISLHKNNSDTNQASNQANPMLISSHGRWFWSDREFDATITPDKIIIENNTAPIQSGIEANLKQAFHTLSRRFFPPVGKLPHKELFANPQYNTWVEFQINQNQAGILDYARNIIRNGFPAGVLMIDDSWQENFGVLNFHPARFPDPKAMVDELHSLGFKVVIWITPFVSPDSMPFRKLFARNLLVKTKDGEPSIRRWWNGYSAMLDLSNPEAVDWLRSELNRLMDEFVSHHRRQS